MYLQLISYAKHKRGAGLLLALNYSAVVAAYVLNLGVAVVGVVVAYERCVEQVLSFEEDAQSVLECLFHAEVELCHSCVPAVVLIHAVDDGEALACVGECQLSVPSALGILEEQRAVYHVLCLTEERTGLVYLSRSNGSCGIFHLAHLCRSDA